MSDPESQLSGLPQSGQRTSMPNETHEKSGDEMWSKYMFRAQKYDERVAEAWKKDSEGVLLFTALFSVIVGAFVIESLKRLSPDSGDETVNLLGDISKQLYQFGNNMTVEPPKDREPFSPDHRMIWVNALWLISLVFAIGSALTATLMQQWARRYIQVPAETLSSQSDQARVRSYLFLGSQKYYMPHAVALTIALLHASVFMFFSGLVIFILAINSTIAHTVLITAGVFTLAYLILTILPCFTHDCPYGTPMSDIWWYMWHPFISVIAQCLHLFLKRVHHHLVRSNTGEIRTSVQRKLVTYLEFFEEVVEKHGKRIKDGFRKSIKNGAREAPLDVDLKALDWFFELIALADETEVQEFVLSVPGDMVVQLMNSSIFSLRKCFCDHLYGLLRSCASATAGLDEEVRKRHLLMGLKTIHHVSRAIIPEVTEPFVAIRHDLRINVANMDLMRIFWADSDPAIRVMSRSICAILARQILRNNLLDSSEMASEMAWLKDVLDMSGHRISSSRNDDAALDSMCIDSFVHSVLSNPSDDLLNDEVFVETLVILMNAGSQTNPVFNTGLAALVQRATHEDHRLHGFLDELNGFINILLSPA